ncbi:phage baseplate assembly protein domain-containing protein [Thiovibrio frasassiensis]|uniref:Phage baseplate assembly protein n=1 Tax=Thiovibrio frasassiensis TaxID=2984131 RepID=A0A9X4MIE4_9BACT|nr:phage baseplate assembly protein [Thiovibrio frasassiensis]MDG4475444.1 phage baseplate assembly protein [Thiovibrio frasassiensis]
MIRVRITSMWEGVIKRFSASGRAGETFTDREVFQHYGYTSRPLPGAEGIADKDGNHIVLVASDDRRYRIPIEEGEVALYDDQGMVIHLKRGKEVHIYGCDKLTADVGAEAKITAPVATVVAATSCQVTSPIINLGGDRGSLRSLIDERFLALFNGHNHGGIQPGSGNSAGPNTTLTLGNTCTSITKAG